MRISFSFLYIVVAKDLIFCPCMGRFGNQLDHYISMLDFAKSIKRRLILPPFIVFKAEIKLVPFESLFDFDEISKFTTVISPENYALAKIETFSCPESWLKENQLLKCTDCESETIGCEISGNPHATFWESLGVKFLNCRKNVWGKWTEVSDEVLALSGSVKSFPAPQSLNHVTKFFKFRFLNKLRSPPALSEGICEFLLV